MATPLKDEFSKACDDGGEELRLQWAGQEVRQLARSGSSPQPAQ
jgi:hypothetical protein